MSNKTIVNGREMRISNHSGADNNTLLTTNKENLIINDNLTVKPEEVVIDKNTTINGNLVVSGSLTSETPAIDNNRLLLNTDSNVVADSSLLPVKDVRASPVGGWYVNNAGTGDKFNFYYYGKTNLPEVHTLEELKYLYCLVDIISGGNMYFSVYTQRQNDGNDAGSWYRSRINYIINGTGSTTETGISLMTVNLKEEPVDIFDSVKRIPCSKEAFSSVGPQAEDEEILTISLQSDSSQPAGAVEYVIQNFGFKLEHVIQNFLHICDIGFNESEVRTIIESYGYLTPAEISTLVESYNYQTESQVNALISTATADFLTEAEILAYGWQTEGQVDALIDGRGYLTEIEIQNLIDGSGDSKYFKAYLDNGGVSVNGQDETFYLSTLNNFVVREGGANWSVDKYTLPEEGNYKVDVHLVAETFTDEFKTVIESLDASNNIEEKFNLDWSADAYGRHSSLVMPNRTAGKKIRVNIYNPQAIGQNIVGKVEAVEITATAPGAYPQFGGVYERVATGLMRNTSPPRQFIPDPSGTPAGIYRRDDGAGTTYILYKLGNNYWYISNHTTATLNANLSGSGNNWQLIGDLLTAPNGYLGQNLNVSQTQSAGNVGGFYGPGAGAASWATGSFTDPTAGVPEYNSHITIHKV